MDFLRANFKKIALVAFFAAAISAAVSMILLYSAMSGKSTKEHTNNILTQVKNHIQENPEKTQFNILLLGYGGEGHSGGGLADAIILANINTETKNVNLIAIPRDTWVELPIRSDLKQSYKINAAYAIGNDDNGYPLKEAMYKGQNGGGELAKYAVEKVTGLTVDYYASVDFTRFENAIDALGGLTVDVPVSFVDTFYPIKGEENNLCDYSLDDVEKLKAQYSGFELEKQFACRYETLDFKQGPTEMDGATALKFIRSRHSSQYGGDFARGQKEQALLVALKNKLLSLDALNNLDDFYAQFGQMIRTDIKEEDVVEMLSHVGNPSDYSSNNININDENYLENSRSSDGQYILIPKLGAENWQDIHSFINSEVR